MKPLLAATATEAPDEQLVAAARAGSDEAFEALFRRYQDRVVGYVRGMVSDHGRAEDIVQEAFISALRSLRRTEQDIVFRPWIYEIAKNACIDHIRRAKRAQEVSIDSDDFGPGEESRLSQAATGTDAAVARRRELESLRMAFHDLPPTQHEILVMRELEGLSYDKIGSRMGLTRGAVESLLFRARRGLRAGFDEIDTGARCESMRAAMESVAEGSSRSRARRRLSSHLHICKPCRRHAISLGLDSLVLGLEESRARRAARRVASFLPLPLFLRRRLGDAAGGLGPASQAGMEQGATLAGKATALIVATVVAAGGAGVAHKASGGTLPLAGGIPVVGDSGGAGGSGNGDAGGPGGPGGAAGGGQGAGGAAGDPGGPAGSAAPAGPNGPAGGGNSALPGGLGGPLDAAAPGAGRATGEAGRLVQAIPGAGGLGRTVESVGGAVGVSPGRTVDQLANGDLKGATKGVTKGVGDTVKNVPQTVKDAPNKVKEVTKTLPEPSVKVPQEIKTPGGGSVNTGEAGKTGPSVTPPKTPLQVPPVQLPPLPKNKLTSGLGL